MRTEALISRFRTIASRIRGFFSSRRLDADFQDELASHLSMLEEENLRRGLPPDEAHRQARLRLGAEAPLRESHHDLRGLPWLESLVQDVRFGLRMLRKSPGFTAVAILTLALGIGANTAIFNLLHAVLFPSLSVPSPNQIFVMHGIRTPNDGAFLYSQPAFQRLKETVADEVDGPGISAHSALAEGELAPYSGAPVEVAKFQLVSTNFFSVIRVPASAGRLFEKADSSVSSNGWPVVLRYGFWKEHFDADPSILGHARILNGTIVSIIGVAARNFDGVIPGDAPDFWLPLGAQHDVRYVGPFDSPGDGRYIDLSKPYNEQNTLFWLTLIARIPPGQSAPALARWNAAFGPDRDIYQKLDSPEQKLVVGNSRFSIVSAASSEGSLSETYSKPLTVLMGMVGLLLLIACLNLANLQRTRIRRRSLELAIRSALGSSGRRLLQQLVAEMIPLGICGGLLSLATARLLGTMLIRLAPGESIHLNLRFGFYVYVVCALLLLVALVLFEILPARELLFSEVSLAARLPSARAPVGAKGRDSGDAMLSLQIALCVLLLSVAAMFVRTLRNLNGLPAGIDRRHVLTVRFDFYHSRFREADLIALYPRMLDRLRILPGVRFVVQDMCPPPNCLWNTPIHAVGISGETESHQDDVGPGYFRAMGIPLLRGREFENGDRRATAQVAIVNRTLARKLFGSNQSPVRRRVGFGKAPDDATYLIVGETADVRVDDVRRAPPPVIYLPIAQHFPAGGSLEIRTIGPGATEIANVRAALRATDAQISISAMTPLDEAYAHTFQAEYLLASFTSAFGILALVLAAIGIYGVQSFRVARRTSEFGVRLALGAAKRDIFTMVVMQALRVSAIGGLAGGALVVLFSHALHNFLFDLRDNGMSAWFLSTVILIAATMLASFLPARRAARIDPMVALRHE